MDVGFEDTERKVIARIDRSTARRIPARARDAVAFSVEAWEPKDREWRAEWNSNGADRTGGVLVPPRVRLILTVRDEEGKEKTYTTQAKVFLTQPLDF